MLCHRSLSVNRRLPPGQKAIDAFPRFGMAAFAPYRPHDLPSTLSIRGRVEHSLEVPFERLSDLSRLEQVSDLHWVTTWKAPGIRWAGYRLREFFERVVEPSAKPEGDATWVVFRGDDGHRASLPLSDALSRDVRLVDTMNGTPLPFEHGAPLRLVAPSHYGHKSVKDLIGVEFWNDFKPGPGLLEHPRGRVDPEERGRMLPGVVLRHLYRPLIRPTIRRFERGRA